MTLNGIRQLDPALIEELKGNPTAQRQYLFIERHPQMQRGFVVNSFDPSWESKIGSVTKKTLLPTKLNAFIDEAATQGYKPVTITEADKARLDQVESWIARLNDVPEVAINSTMPGTINGFLHFQVQGFNTLKDEQAGWLEWSTGTGKTVGAAALTKYHQILTQSFSVGIWWVKSHNKKNTQRALDALVGVNTVIIAGTPAKRAKLYAEVQAQIRRGERPVMILNYEQARSDFKILTEMLYDEDVLYVMDEAPTKLRNHRTQTWKAFCAILYSSVDKKGNPTPDGELRVASLRAYVTSAITMKNGAMDFFNVVRLISPKALGTFSEFNKAHCVWESMRIVGRGGRIIETKQITGYKNLDQIGIKVSHIMHSVDKRDPDIAKLFPKMMSEDLWIDLSDHQQKLYNKLASRYADTIKKFAAMQTGGRLTDEDKRELQKLRAVFTVLQMIVDDPALVLDAAEEFLRSNGEKGSEVALELRSQVNDDSQFEDDGEETRVAKNEAIRDLIEGNTDKVIAFSTHGAPYQARLSKWLTKWGIGHVIYNGSMSMNQKQAAEDTFKSDPDCKLFLSSDAGSDSINLQVADLALHINLPWTPDTYEQRENRLHRVTSEFGHVRVITLMTDTEPELHKAEILEKKRGYQQGTKKTLGVIARELREIA